MTMFLNFFCVFNHLLLISLISLIIFFENSCASLGDSFPSYKHCVKSCKQDVCDEDGYYYADKTNSPSLSSSIFSIMDWPCVDDCRYKCMWKVVDSFAAKGWPPPQFHGKWPFARWLGMQEPASVVFSLFNLVATIMMLRRFYQQVRPGGPMYWCWTIYAFVCVNAWVWSAVFHTRDLPFTEIMDYLSAFAMVFYSLYGIIMRMLLRAPIFVSFLLTLAFLSFFFNHAAYLIMDQFDYQYNMTANIVIGVLSAGFSTIWSILNWKRHNHSRYLVMCLVWGLLTLLLEVSDFPPIVWTFDAHALWHFSTVPVPYFFWSFVIEDCKYLRKSYMKER